MPGASERTEIGLFIAGFCACNLISDSTTIPGQTVSWTLCAMLDKGHYRS